MAPNFPDTWSRDGVVLERGLPSLQPIAWGSQAKWLAPRLFARRQQRLRSRQINDHSSAQLNNFLVRRPWMECGHRSGLPPPSLLAVTLFEFSSGGNPPSKPRWQIPSPSQGLSSLLLALRDGSATTYQAAKTRRNISKTSDSRQRSLLEPWKSSDNTCSPHALARFVSSEHRSSLSRPGAAMSSSDACESSSPPHGQHQSTRH